MKKIFILLSAIFLLCFVSINAHADWDTGLNKINRVLNTIDRTESTINRAQRRVESATNSTNTNSSNRKTTVYTNSAPATTQNSNQSVNYGNQNYYVNEDNEIPEYSMEQTVQEGEYKYSQNKTYTGDAKTLGELPAGTIVMDPKSVWTFRWGDNYSDRIIAEHPVFWRKLEDNHYNDGSTLLLSEVRVAMYPFCHSQKGLRDWAESDVRRFLRTTFYTHLSDGFRNAIVNVNIPYADMSGAPKTIEDNFFLLSIVEWGLSDRANNGTVIKYKNLPEIYEAKNFYYVDSWNAFNITGAGRGIETRTINRPVAKSAGYDNDVFEVRYNGVLSTGWSASNLAWVRPAVNLKSSTKVKGPYKFRYSINKKESFIYYVLDFD